MRHEYAKIIFSDKLGLYIKYKSVKFVGCGDCYIYEDFAVECNRTYYKCNRLHEEILGIEMNARNELENYIPVQALQFSLFLVSKLIGNYGRKEVIDITDWVNSDL